jgi:hypothetical protein
VELNKKNTIVKPSFSKEIYNPGLTRVILKQDKNGKIVLHPRKSMRFNNEEADLYLKRFAQLKELKKEKK